MKKDIIASNINHKADVTRILTTNQKLNFIEGKIYDNRGRAESWSDRNLNTKAFISETNGKYKYVLEAYNVPCHLVDYNNIKETEMLGATDCKSEGEVLVPSNAIFKILNEPNEGDFKETGYYYIELEFVGFVEEEKTA